MKKLVISLIILAFLGLGFYFVRSYFANMLDNDPDFACGNGRIEATEINIAAKLAGKVEKVLVREGDRVVANQELVKMQTNVLEADLAQARAKREQAIASEISARANVAVQEAKLETMKAECERIRATANNAQSNYTRQKTLLAQNATSQQHFDAAEANYLAQKAALSAALAAIKESEAQLNVAKADANAAKANILAAEADIDSIQADIDDSTLRAPLDGRVQYRITEPGEVLGAGGRALNMVDLTDVYMTFFLPEATAGKVQIGTDARILLDALPGYPIPAKISYVASVAQFTPKTVETRIERQKLMFRLKAHIDRELLAKFIDLVKTGLPGEVWIKLNPDTPWPEKLQTRKIESLMK